MPAPDPRPTLESPDDDPYLWLEDIESSRSLTWVEGQNTATLNLFGHGQTAADRDLLKAIFDRPDNIPYPSRVGGRLVWRRQDTLFRPRPLIEDNSVSSKASYPVSARLGYKFEDGLIVRVDGFNLLNQEASQIDYFLRLAPRSRTR
jgi:hypothetical protein